MRIGNNVGKSLCHKVIRRCRAVNLSTSKSHHSGASQRQPVAMSQQCHSCVDRFPRHVIGTPQPADIFAAGWVVPLLAVVFIDSQARTAATIYIVNQYISMFCVDGGESADFGTLAALGRRVGRYLGRQPFRASA
jgi:hypothetical protein